MVYVFGLLGERRPYEMNPDRNHVWMYKSFRNTVRDSSFYGGQGNHSESYGVEGYATGDNLVENNIFQHVTGPIKRNGSESGSVYTYNFSIDDNYTAQGSAPGWEIPTLAFHEVGISYVLDESNDGLGILHDGIHGTTHFNTAFRNHLYGDVWNNPAKNSNTAIINLASYGRYFNIVGNVLGRTGYYTTYETNLDEAPKSIYAIGWSPTIGTVPPTIPTRRPRCSVGATTTRSLERSASWPPRSPRGSRNTPTRCRRTRTCRRRSTCRPDPPGGRPVSRGRPSGRT